jgi:hypothetical protein
MMTSLAHWRFWLGATLLFLTVSCQQSPSTATVPAVTPPPAAPSETPQPSTPTVAAAVTPTAVNTATPTPSPTITASPTAAPLVQIWVVDEISGEPVAEAVVHLALFRQITNELGQALFARAHAISDPYAVRVTAAGYHAAQSELIVGRGVTELTVALEPAVFARVTAESAALRTGPGLVYPAVATATMNDLLLVVGQSTNGNWVVVETAAGETAWLAAMDVAIEGELASVVAVAAPATPTPAPTTAPIASAPPPSSASASLPLGPNLLFNPGFEQGSANWHQQSHISLRPASFYNGRFVRSGEWSASGHQIQQTVMNVTPGVSYRFGAWATIWSSGGDDPQQSENPADIVMYVCLNTDGDDDLRLPTTICTQHYRPLDTWQFIAVDAVAQRDRVAVMLVTRINWNAPYPLNNVAAWDDAYLGLAPVAVTPTPVPPPPPARPQPIPFTPNEMIASMNELRATLENMGGLLDRLYQGTGGTCAEFEAYYRQLIVSKTYHSIPGEWQTIYSDYLWAAEQALATNDAIYALCTGEGRRLLTFFNYSVGRTGINDSLSRLIPAIEAASALLNQ